VFRVVEQTPALRDLASWLLSPRSRGHLKLASFQISPFDHYLPRTARLTTIKQECSDCASWGHSPLPRPLASDFEVSSRSSASTAQAGADRIHTPRQQGAWPLAPRPGGLAGLHHRPSRTTTCLQGFSPSSLSHLPLPPRRPRCPSRRPIRPSRATRGPRRASQRVAASVSRAKGTAEATLRRRAAPPANNTVNLARTTRPSSPESSWPSLRSSRTTTTGLRSSAEVPRTARAGELKRE